MATNTTKQEESNGQPAVNSTASMKASSVSDAELKKQTEKAQKAFEKEKLVTVSVPSAFEPKLGKNWFIGVNGVSITIPVDGEDHEVPEVFARHIKQALKNLK